VYFRIGACNSTVITAVTTPVMYTRIVNVMRIAGVYRECANGISIGHELVAVFSCSLSIRIVLHGLLPEHAGLALAPSVVTCVTGVSGSWKPPSGVDTGCGDLLHCLMFALRLSVCS
jgi:hypothetical protein